jgi:hypothetical protein
LHQAVLESDAQIRVKFNDNTERDLAGESLLFAPAEGEKRIEWLDSLAMRDKAGEPIALSTELTPAALRLQAAAVQAGEGMLSGEGSAARDPSRKYAKQILGWHNTFLNAALSPEERISNFNALINKIAELIKDNVARLNSVSEMNLDPEEEFINAVALLTTAFTSPRWQDIVINKFLFSPSNKNIAAFTAFAARPTFAARNNMIQRIKAAVAELNAAIGDNRPEIADLVGEGTGTQELYTPYRKYLATLNQAAQTAVDGLPHTGEAGSRTAAREHVTSNASWWFSILLHNCKIGSVVSKNCVTWEKARLSRHCKVATKFPLQRLLPEDLQHGLLSTQKVFTKSMRHSLMRILKLLSE